MALTSETSALRRFATHWRNRVCPSAGQTATTERPDVLDDEVRTAELSEAMLRFMRSPDELIESVKESVRLRDRAILATTEIQFSQSLSASQLEYRYVDILHLDKGLATHVSVETTGAELASHAEHVAVARDAIGYRFAHIVDNLILITSSTPDILKKIEHEMARVRADLESIPGLSRPKALTKFKEHFTWDGSQKWLSRIRKMEGVDHVYYRDDGTMQALHRLCKRLVHKYLLLVRVPLHGRKLKSLRFSVERPYSTMSTEEGKPAMLKRHVFFGSTPSTFRYHTPWAKRTAHYSFTSLAPYGQFFSNVDVLSHTPETLSSAGSAAKNMVITPSATVPFSWAVSLDQGDRVNFFVGQGRSWMQPLYLSLTHRELPGRSLLRAITLAGTALVLMATFFVLRVILDTPLSDATIAVLTLLTLGGLASPWPRDPGPLGIPILSRITPVMVAALSTGFLVWLLKYDKVYGAFGVPGGFIWGILCVVAALAIVVHLIRRIAIQGKSYKRAVNLKPIIGGAFH